MSYEKRPETALQRETTRLQTHAKETGQPVPESDVILDKDGNRLVEYVLSGDPVIDNLMRRNYRRAGLIEEPKASINGYSLGFRNPIANFEKNERERIDAHMRNLRFTTQVSDEERREGFAPELQSVSQADAPISAEELMRM